MLLCSQRLRRLCGHHLQADLRFAHHSDVISQSQVVHKVAHRCVLVARPSQSCLPKCVALKALAAVPCSASRAALVSALLLASTTARMMTQPLSIPRYISRLCCARARAMLRRRPGEGLYIEEPEEVARGSLHAAARMYGANVHTEAADPHSSRGQPPPGAML